MAAYRSESGGEHMTEHDYRIAERGRLAPTPHKPEDGKEFGQEERELAPLSGIEWLLGKSVTCNENHRHNHPNHQTKIGRQLDPKPE